MPLYPYQERVKKLLHNGKPVILQAPTGAGKTRAALAPFIEAFFDHPPGFFPRKCIYSVPMKVLANQFFAEYDFLTAKYSRKHRRDMTVSIQTGDRPNDPKIESNLVFTTIDQTLSNYLSTPYGVGKRSANINAGAVVSSYLIFDELHLYDPDSTLPTTLAMLHELKEITPFIVMTATFSSKMLERLANYLDAVVVPEKQEDRISMENIGSQVGKDRRFYTVDAPLTAHDVLATEGIRTVCICNTVARSQQLYADLKYEIDAQEEEVEITLLHSRFYREHRKEKEEQIKEKFGRAKKEYEGPRQILVATQVIEVGLDITCDVMHTEIAPASSLLQRSGRCARKEHEQGKIFVYLPRNDDGEPNFIPYHLPPRTKDNYDKKRSSSTKKDRGLRLCQATWDALSTEKFSDVHMSFRNEQALIDRVHKPIDEEILDGISATSRSHQKAMESVMATCDRGQAADLIREVHSTVFVTLHANPSVDEKIIRNPWYYDGFSLTTGQLYRVYKLWEDGEIGFDGWPMFWAQQSETAMQGQAYDNPDYLWTAIREPGEVYGKPIIAVDPRFIHYSREMGLWLDERGEYREPQKRPKGNQQQHKYLYELETYTEHAQGLYKAYMYPQDWHLPLKEEVEFAAQRLEGYLGVSEGALDTMLRALFALHDLGKLDNKWQVWAHNWQADAGQFFDGQDLGVPDDYLAAHTDYDSNDKEQQKVQSKIRPRRPNHAGESAMAGSGVIGQLCEENENLGKAAFTAIARHHSPLTRSYAAYNLHKAAKGEIEETLKAVHLKPELKQFVRHKDEGNETFTLGRINFSSIEQRLLYFFFVRILRLADQRSQI